MQIKKYTGKMAQPQEAETVFFIQSHGNNAGRPLKEPIPNCWEVRTVRQQDWEILSIVFISKVLDPFITGSVIPFIRLSDYKKIIAPILKHGVHKNGKLNARYLQIRQIEELIRIKKEQLSKLGELKTAISHQTIKTLKSENAL